MNFKLMATEFLVIFLITASTGQILPYSYQERSLRLATVTIGILRSEPAELYPSSLTITFFAFHKNFELKLWKNSGMFASNYSRVDDNNGKRHYVGSSSEICQYNGALGNSRSYVAMSTCRGFEGIFHDGNHMYTIWSDDKNLRGKHTIEKHFGVFLPEIIPKIKHSMRYIEMVVAIDQQRISTTAEDRYSPIELAINIANLLTEFLNIKIVMKELVVLRSTRAPIMNLGSLFSYRKRKQLDGNIHDFTLLISSTKNIILKSQNSAVIKAMCLSEYSAAIVYKQVEVKNTGLLIAHAIGHSLGAGHVNEQCSCFNDCVMSPYEGRFTMQWSNCSMSRLNWFYSKMQDSCLQNKPVTIKEQRTSSICGNGIIEGDEKCDCGKNCDEEKCCDKTTCQFIVGASCSTGDCCDTDMCQLKGKATICRTSKNECELEEYCTGKSSKCPINTYKQDGFPCSNKTSFCYQGECKSHDKQCKRLWGSQSTVAANTCFEYNILGTNKGFCAFNLLQKTYNKCQKADVLCGKVFCIKADSENFIGTQQAEVTNIFIRNSDKTINICTSMILDFGIGVRNPGLVENGAKCGSNHMCIDSKCRNIDELVGKRKDCSGNGILNNFGQCHCFLGYGSHDCSRPGPGGSLASGPASIFLSAETTTKTIVTSQPSTEHQIFTDFNKPSIEMTKTKSNQESTTTEVTSTTEFRLENFDEDEAIEEFEDILDLFLDSLDF